MSPGQVGLLFKKPVSVLVVIYTVELEVLLLCRQKPAGFWQSVTGSLELDEQPVQTAQRELLEETGITVDVIDHGVSRVYPIAPAWRKRYAPGVVDNLEHEFGVQLPGRCPVTINKAEHSDYRWLPMDEAIALASSRSNRAALRAIWKAEA